MKKITCILITIFILLTMAICAGADSAPVTVTNGQIIVATDYEQVCSFSVETKSEYIYYVYLKYQRAPTTSTVSRTLKSNASGKQSDISFIVAPNSIVKLKVPIGVYKLYYCVGTTWYGTNDKFGDNTRYYSSDGLLDFYADSKYYCGKSLELWAQAGGNFEDHSISEGNFPDTEMTSSVPATKGSTTENSSSPKNSSGSVSSSSGKYLTVDDLPDRVDNMDELVKAWLSYPSYNSDFHAVNPEVTINKGERTKMMLFRNENYNGASYDFSWYGDSDVSLDWAGNGVGWAGHSHVGYITATKACTIFMSAKDSDGIIAHMVIHVK